MSHALVGKPLMKDDRVCLRAQSKGKAKVSRLRDILFVWAERIKQRRDLQELADSPQLLMDIGVSRDDVMLEAKKTFWRE